MIKYDYEITVNGNTAKLNKDIHLFRENKNVNYYFAIKNASFNFKGSTDLIEKTNAINAAVTVIKPNGVEVANAIAPVENGKIHLKVTEDLIDEEVEVGDFDLVFDLFDDVDGAVTIPKVAGQFHVLERPCTTPISELVATNTTNEVDQALTDYAIVTYAEPVASTNEDGTFAKKTWVPKEKITTAELNRIEEGIFKNNSQYKDIEQQIEQGGTFPENLVLWEDDGLGEDDKEIEYTLPIATSTILGGVKPVSKTTEMTQEVGVDSDGKLYTNPSSSSSGEHTSSAISEVIANDELVNTIISSGQTSGSVFSTKLNWEQLKQYKRFAVIFKGESNMGAANTYVQIGTTKIARFGESGFYGEYNFLGANLLECYSTSGNQSMISLTPYDTVDMSYTGRLQKGQSLGDMSSVLNTDVLSVNFSSKTTINYTLKIIGLTKGV